MRNIMFFVLLIVCTCASADQLSVVVVVTREPSPVIFHHEYRRELVRSCVDEVLNNPRYKALVAREPNVSGRVAYIMRECNAIVDATYKFERYARP